MLTTVLGALYQLATMFTQTRPHGVDVHLRRFEEVAFPCGVLALASGRLLGSRLLALLGAGLVVLALIAFSAILGRRLVETRVPWTPMLSRYAVVTVALAAWAAIAALTWARTPLARASLFGSANTTHLLFLGVVGFVVMGSLYHIIPFIVWMNRYSDLLGLESVPMIDDLYDSRLATLDLGLLLAGGTVLTLDGVVSLPAIVGLLGGIATVLGFLVFAANMALVIRPAWIDRFQSMVIPHPFETKKEEQVSSRRRG